MNVAVIVFPGSSGETDCFKAVQETIGESVDYVSCQSKDLSKYDCIILPGGSSYGDYLRAGAIASHAPVIDEVVKAAEAGKYVLGIGNGFQVLLESRMLPGVMLPNVSQKFLCAQASLRVENNQTPFSVQYEAGEVVDIPIAHGSGNYYCEDETLAQLQRGGQIVFRYAGENPNGSLDHIAGICNGRGNVLGMMPHPERAVHPLLGSVDGQRMFTSILATWREHHGKTVNG